MAASLFRHRVVDSSWVPWWLTGPNRGRVMWAIGLALDTAVTWAQLGLLERFPMFCSEEALFWIGRDRGIPRGFAESADSYRVRLTQWLQTRSREGLAWSILHTVRAYFLPRQVVVRLVTGDTSVAQWWSVDKDGNESFHRAEPSNWDWDSAEPGQTPVTGQRRYWLIIYQPDSGDMFELLGPEHEQDPTLTRGTAGLVLQARDMTFLGRLFKQAGTWLAGVIVASDTASFAPDGSGAGYPDGRWYRYADPATYTPVRLTTARYFADRRRPGLFEEGLESEIP
jgi:hypothetical protein